MKSDGYITCCVCEHSIKPIRVLENVKDGWHIMRCPECELRFVHPQPSADIISSYYNGMYSDLAAEYSEKKMNWARNSVKEYHRMLKKIESTSNTLLDLGGGLGYYSKAFEEAGYAVTLVEQDPVSASFARNTLHVNDLVEKSTDEFFENNTEKFDVVFLRHVIEHSTNPDVLIREVSKCLSEKGVLIIETPNNRGVEFLFKPSTTWFFLRLYRSSFTPSSFLTLLCKKPYALDPPRHLYGFRPSNLSMLLQRFSLQPMETKCYRLGHPVYWPNCPPPSLMQLLGNFRNGNLKEFAANMADIAFYPLRIVLEYAGLASGMCIYARKNSSG